MTKKEAIIALTRMQESIENNLRVTNDLIKKEMMQIPSCVDASFSVDDDTINGAIDRLRKLQEQRKDEKEQLRICKLQIDIVKWINGKKGE